MWKIKLAKLIDVKTVITFVIIGVYAYLACIGKIDSKDFSATAGMILVFFFTRVPNNNNKGETPNE